MEIIYPDGKKKKIDRRDSTGIGGRLDNFGRRGGSLLKSNNDQIIIF